MQTIDAVNNKKQIKALITSAIANEIALRVEETYERLLIWRGRFCACPIAYSGLG